MDWYWYLLGCLGVVLFLLIEDLFFARKHTIRANFPVVGRIRYLLEKIGPGLRQYWVANDKEEAPFNRDERRWIYASSKGETQILVLEQQKTSLPLVIR